VPTTAHVTLHAAMQSIHRTVVELRKLASGRDPQSHPFHSLNGSDISTDYNSSIAGTSTAPSSRAVSKGGAAAAGPPDRPAAASALAELGAKAEATASRPLVLTSAVDSSLQAVQAAKLSLQNMHDKDLRLELISQSVKDVLEGRVSSSHRTSRACIVCPVSLWITCQGIVAGPDLKARATAQAPDAESAKPEKEWSAAGNVLIHNTADSLVQGYL